MNNTLMLRSISVQESDTLQMHLTVFNSYHPPLALSLKMYRRIKQTVQRVLPASCSLRCVDTGQL